DLDCAVSALDERVDRHLPRIAAFVADHPGLCATDGVCNADCDGTRAVTTDADCGPADDGTDDLTGGDDGTGEPDEVAGAGDPAGDDGAAASGLMGGCAAGGDGGGAAALVLALAAVLGARRRRRSRPLAP